MPAKKKAAAKSTEAKADEQTPAAPSGNEPSDVNSALSSDRMKALLEDHRKMGVRP